MSNWVRYVIASLVGVLIWEVLNLSAMNAYDRADLVDKIEESHSRAVGYEDRFMHSGGKEPTLEDRLDIKATEQFKKCGGRQPIADVPSTYYLASYLIGNNRRDSVERYRLDLASMNSAFKLRAVQICRSFGQCRGPWPSFIQQPDMRYYRDLQRQNRTDARGFGQIVLDYACGLGVRSSR